MFAKQQVLLIAPIFVLACAHSDEKSSLKFDLDLQRQVVSSRSLTASYLYPILEIQNLSPSSIFVYYMGRPVVRVDSSYFSIELDYSIEELPENLTYYEFPYPLFLYVVPNCNIKLYNQVELYKYIKDIRAGEWEVYANIGYLEQAELFRGYVDHGLRDQITRYQKLLRSTKTKLTVVKE